MLSDACVDTAGMRSVPCMTNTVASFPARTRPEALAATDALAACWMAAWNAHDMHAAAVLLAPDVEFITVGGLWLRGRSEFLVYHQRIHAIQMRDSRWTNLAIDSRLLRDDLAMVHLEWMIVGDRDPDGTPRAPREGIFTWLAVYEACGGAWHIKASHNTNLRRDVKHRLSACRGSKAQAPEGTNP